MDIHWLESMREIRSGTYVQWSQLFFICSIKNKNEGCGQKTRFFDSEFKGEKWEKEGESEKNGTNVGNVMSGRKGGHPLDDVPVCIRYRKTWMMITVVDQGRRTITSPGGGCCCWEWFCGVQEQIVWRRIDVENGRKSTYRDTVLRKGRLRNI